MEAVKEEKKEVVLDNDDKDILSAIGSALGKKREKRVSDFMHTM